MLTCKVCGDARGDQQPDTFFWPSISKFGKGQLLMYQAWYLTEAIAFIAPGLCLGALSKVPIEIYKFLIEVPFAKEKSPCPFKYEVSGLDVWLQHLFRIKIYAF